MNFFESFLICENLQVMNNFWVFWINSDRIGNDALMRLLEVISNALNFSEELGLVIEINFTLSTNDHWWALSITRRSSDKPSHRFNKFVDRFTFRKPV